MSIIFWQETNIEIVHVTGAFLVFGLGTVYAFVQAGLTYQMYPEFNGLLVCRVRMAISAVSLVGLIVSILLCDNPCIIINSIVKVNKYNG